jgi:hypothetical protein
MRYSLLLFIFYHTFCYSQNELGTWSTTNINLKINDKWQVFAESQLRSLKFYDNFHYYEIKTGITYKIKPNFYINSGFGNYNTYSENGNFAAPIKQKEIRTWIQLVFKNPFNFMSVEHRYRAEQRYTNLGYRNRFRYRLSAKVPIFKGKEKEYFLLGWNELFFTNNEPFFERNRLFLGGGFDINKNLAIQTGYIYQFDYKINDETGRDFLNIVLLYSFDFKGEKETNLD